MPNKCDDCGKFIPWDDIESGKAISHIHPDTEFNSEWHESVCKRCNNKERNIEVEKNRYVIVRTYSAGVFAGELKERNGREVTLLNARRLWYWEGAASLSQLAMEGTSAPDRCKFPCEVNKVELLEAIEILDVTDKGEKSIKSVPIWES